MLRVAEEGCGQPEPLPHARARSRQTPAALRHLGEADERQDLLDAGRRRRPLAAATGPEVVAGRPRDGWA